MRIKKTRVGEVPLVRQKILRHSGNIKSMNFLAKLRKNNKVDITELDRVAVF